MTIDVTIAAMDTAGVELGLLSAWHGPGVGALISNEEVAGWVAEHPDRFAGLAAADLAKPMEGCASCTVASRISASRDCARSRGYGKRRPPIAATTRSTPHASNWVSRSAPRSDTPVRCAPAGRLHEDSKRSPQGSLRVQLPDDRPAKALEDLPMLELDEEGKQLYIAGNARRVFNLA